MCKVASFTELVHCFSFKQHTHLGMRHSVTERARGATHEKGKHGKTAHTQFHLGVVPLPQFYYNHPYLIRKNGPCVHRQNNSSLLALVQRTVSLSLEHNQIFHSTPGKRQFCTDLWVSYVYLIKLHPTFSPRHPRFKNSWRRRGGG